MYVIENLNNVDERGFVPIEVIRDKSNVYGADYKDNSWHLIDIDDNITSGKLTKLAETMSEIICDNPNIKAYRVDYIHLMNYVMKVLEDTQDFERASFLHKFGNMSKLTTLSTTIICDKHDSDTSIYFISKIDNKSVLSNLSYASISDFLGFVDYPSYTVYHDFKSIIFDWFGGMINDNTRLYDYVAEQSIHRFDLLTTLIHSTDIEIIPINKMYGIGKVYSHIQQDYLEHSQCDIMKFIACTDMDSVIIPTILNIDESERYDGITIIIDANSDNYDVLFDKLDYIAKYILCVNKPAMSFSPIYTLIDYLEDGEVGTVTIDKMYQMLKDIEDQCNSLSCNICEHE